VIFVGQGPSARQRPWIVEAPEKNVVEHVEG
jgi:hypothetical protein